jgi:hypothetical protein
MNRTIVVDLTKHEVELAPVLLGAAEARRIPAHWGTGAVLIALNPSIAEHREMEESIRSAGLVVHVR